jgi:hypothetical protein
MGQQNNNNAHRKAEGNKEDTKSNNRRIKTQIGTIAPLKLILYIVN